MTVLVTGGAGYIGSHTVRALRDAVTMRFDRERVESYSDSAHVIYRNIASILATRLDESSELLTELATRGPDTLPAPLS